MYLLHEPEEVGFGTLLMSPIKRSIWQKIILHPDTFQLGWPYLYCECVSDWRKGLVWHVLQAGVLPVVHGSALGQQGLSQVIVTSTIGDDGSAAKSEGITGETRQQLMVQLNTRVAAATEVQPSSSAC